LELHDVFGGVVGAQADLDSIMKRLLTLRSRVVGNATGIPSRAPSADTEGSEEV
jgi:hypothetical protein